MTLPPLVAPYAGGDPTQALADARAVIEDAIVNHPRSQQVEIGPSEIGTECDHCLAHKLLGTPQARDVAWLPTVGTAVHGWIEDVFIRHENARGAQHNGGLRYLVEKRVKVGQIDGVDVYGNVDLFDTVVGMTNDWKIVGASSLKKSKRGPSSEYKIQAHAYGKGLEDEGFTVKHVGISFLPRNAVSLNEAVWWHEPYDRQVAVDALARCSGLARNLKALAALGPDAVTAYIATLARAEGCWDCSRFPGGAHLPKPGHRPPANQLAGLV